MHLGGRRCALAKNNTLDDFKSVSHMFLRTDVTSFSQSPSYSNILNLNLTFFHRQPPPSSCKKNPPPPLLRAPPPLFLSSTPPSPSKKARTPLSKRSANFKETVVLNLLCYLEIVKSVIKNHPPFFPVTKTHTHCFFPPSTFTWEKKQKLFPCQGT